MPAGERVRRDAPLGWHLWRGHSRRAQFFTAALIDAIVTLRMQWQHIIFQHTPKCAGAALRIALAEAFGKDQYRWDGSDQLSNPMAIFNIDPVRYWRDARLLQPATTVVAGHFPIRKYAHIRNALRLALIRHPVERAISHYCYWTAPAELPPNPLRNYIIANKLDVLSFARLPFIRDYYRRFYFAAATPPDFDLIIDQCRFARGVERLSAIIDRPLFVCPTNVTSGISEATASRRRAILENAAVIERLTKVLTPEIHFYQRVTSWPAAQG